MNHMEYSFRIAKEVVVMFEIPWFKNLCLAEMEFN